MVFLQPQLGSEHNGFVTFANHHSPPTRPRHTTFHSNVVSTATGKQSAPLRTASVKLTKKEAELKTEAAAAGDDDEEEFLCDPDAVEPTALPAIASSGAMKKTWDERQLAAVVRGGGW